MATFLDKLADDAQLVMRGTAGLDLGAATVPAAGPITATEQSIANNVIRTRPVAVSTSIVPAPMNARTALVGSDAAWFANVTYWLAYRHPANPWRRAGNPAGPVTFSDPDSPWAERWKVIYSYIQLALSVGVDDIPPLGDVPTRFEEDAGVFYMSQGGEQGDYDVDPDVIPPPQNTPPPGEVNHHAWAANVVYWLVYVYPTSTWVATGHAPAPIKIPGADSPWAAVWKRIYLMMAKYK